MIAEKKIKFVKRQTTVIFIDIVILLSLLSMNNLIPELFFQTFIKLCNIDNNFMTDAKYWCLYFCCKRATLADLGCTDLK